MRKVSCVFLLSCLAIGCLLCAAAMDVGSRRIPNKLVIALLVLAGVRMALALPPGGPVPTPVLDLAGALAVFGLGAIGFRLGILGGGDAKLLAAGAFWVGAQGVGLYLAATACAGGVLALVGLARLAMPRTGGAVMSRPSLPYGVAIAAGGLLATLAG